MTEAVPAPKLDVFLSYKREERDVAEALASYLTTQGYDVWWDAALLAGEDFVKIVHAELVEARAGHRPQGDGTLARGAVRPGGDDSPCQQGRIRRFLPHHRQ
ncbi:MAG: toll/interleukin-1 receptor domain-containing protein [Devosia sp.]|uniref:toll/interleukin-1 receptor domain-containing protein n=1 Tax=Devosia sp. TaxID=1871048 RepID=UPI0037BFAB20